jgi:hypothetical protein
VLSGLAHRVVAVPRAAQVDFSTIDRRGDRLNFD